MNDFGEVIADFRYARNKANSVTKELIAQALIGRGPHQVAKQAYH